MPALRELQQAMRDAVICGVSSGLRGELIGGDEPEERLRIHQRNYEASLLKAMQQKFPATAWLVGTEYLLSAASIYIREFPPQDPCIARYGADFPQYLGAWAGSERIPYIRDFAELEWLVGQASIATEQAPVPIEHLRVYGERISDAMLALQPGLGYLRSGWPVDMLLRHYLEDTAPDKLHLGSETAYIEVRGSRGRFGVQRLTAAQFTFRHALLRGNTIGSAAEMAQERDPSFDPGTSLADLFAGHFITASQYRPTGDLS